MTATQPPADSEGSAEPMTKAGRMLLEDIFGNSMILEPLEAILAIEAEARAATPVPSAKALIDALKYAAASTNRTLDTTPYADLAAAMKKRLEKADANRAATPVAESGLREALQERAIYIESYDRYVVTVDDALAALAAAAPPAGGLGPIPMGYTGDLNAEERTGYEFGIRHANEWLAARLASRDQEEGDA